jgi:translocation and assembly module TamB
MRRGAKIAAWAAGVPVAVLMLMAGILLAGPNTAPGRHLIERLVPRLSGGKIALAGFNGRWPGEIGAAQVEIRDGHGAWLRIEGLTIAWSPLQLLFGRVEIERLAAARVALSRLPGNSGGSGFALPVRVDRFRIGRLELAPAVAGGPVALGLSGRLRLDSGERAAIDVEARQLGGPGRYALEGRIGPAGIRARITAAEPAHGPLADIIRLPDLGPLAIAANLAGPREAERARLTIAAGPLRAAAQGTIDLLHRTLNLDASARAPAMAPRPDLSWHSARLEGHVHGPFASPAATGHLDVEGIAAGGGTIARLTADIRGAGGKLGVSAAVAGLRLPGPQPELLAAVPLEFHAEARLDAPRRPVTFSLSHPLLTIAGHAETGNGKGRVAGSFDATVPALAPWAAANGIDVQGQARLKADFSVGGGTERIAAGGVLSVTGGLPAAVRLFGSDTRLSLAAALSGKDVDVERVGIAGKAFEATASGSAKGGVLAFAWRFAISDLSRLDPHLSGALAAQGRLAGPVGNLGLVAQAKGDIAGAGLPRIPVTLSLGAQGLPGTPKVQIAAQGRLAGAPLQFAASGARGPDGTLHLSIAHARWQSGEGEGVLTLAPGARVPLGHLRLRMARLDQLRPLIHEVLSGRLDARVDLREAKGQPQAALRIDVRNLASGGASVAQARLDGTIGDPLSRPRLALRLAFDGIAASGLSGTARIAATGPLDALGLRLSSDLRMGKGPAQVSATATADLFRRELAIAALRASYGGETARLLAPARVTFMGGLAIERLRLGIGGAVLTATGRVSPQLGLTVSLRNASPALVAPFLPKLRAEGTIALEASLNGSLAQPGGTIRVSGRDLRLQGGAAGGVPAADLTASANLRGGTALITAQLTAGGAVRLRLAGAAPLKPGAPLALRASGTLDLAVVDPLLAADGRSLRGQLTLAAGISGTLAAPRVSGDAQLAHGDFRDFVLGVHVSDMAGTVAAEGDRLRIRQLTGRAGPGRLSLSGTVAAFAPGIPVDLALTAHDARLLASDLLTANVDGDVTLRGQATGQLTLGGAIRVRRADIEVPASFPPSVAVLNVRRPGEKAPPAPQAGPRLGLALTIDAPERVFVRGHGLDAELGGRLTLAGTSAAPLVTGGFELRHGTFSLAGQTLTFTRGNITFTGESLARQLDPALHLIAQSSAGGTAATLAVTGYADAPKITLTSTPPLPQDEVLSQLLFGQSVKQLSPFQFAAIAGGLASLGGFGGDPLAAMRKSLGLDRLSVESASGTGGGAAISAGKYVASRVYLGVKQGTSGGTQAQVQIDLTKHLKLQSTLGTRAGTPATGITPQNDPGSSIGLSYQFEY